MPAFLTNICNVFLFAFLLTAACNKSGKGTLPDKPEPPPGTAIEYWITKGDQSALLQKQVQPLSFGAIAGNLPSIEVDSTTSFQTIDGFGYTLTGGSAMRLR